MRPLPVVWLLGKVQSGKSSIIRALTQLPAIEIGQGYKPCTRTSFTFDFPPEEPIIRFLDTRGIGERAYDATPDTAVAAASSHLVIAAVRAMDMQQAEVLEILEDVRRRHPNWPILIALTNLHEGYPLGAKHIRPYPFEAEQAASLIPVDLHRAITFQKETFAKLPGHGRIVFVAVDFTRPEDGCDPIDYGIDALIAAMIELAPAALAGAIAALPASPLSHEHSRSRTSILRHAAAAAGADVVPIAGLVAVPAIQARMLKKIAELHGVVWEKRTAAEFAAALGSAIVARTLVASGARQLSRLVPVYGQTVAVAASSTSSFATTYALGMAARKFLSQRKSNATVEDVSETYRRALQEALYFARKPSTDGAKSDAKASPSQ